MFFLSYVRYLFMNVTVTYYLSTTHDGFPIIVFCTCSVYRLPYLYYKTARPGSIWRGNVCSSVVRTFVINLCILRSHSVGIGLLCYAMLSSQVSVKLLFVRIRMQHVMQWERIRILFFRVRAAASFEIKIQDTKCN